MTDIQPWSSEAVVRDYMDGSNRVWYTEADHLAAVAAAGQRAVNDFREAMNESVWYLSGQEYGYEQGQRDALAAAVQRVEAIPADGGWISNGKVWRHEAIAAITGGQ